jgi:Na+/proline symporter
LALAETAHLMQNERERERAKIDGRAAFAGAAYLIGVGLIYLLARVGAPDGLVRALGPLFALAGVVLIGALTRSTRVPAFFTADRAMPAPYAGLAFAAIAAGFVLCLDIPGPSPLPLAGVAAGLCLNAVVVAPRLRATMASAPSDLLATRFPSLPLRWLLAALQLAIGALVAAAGFAAATGAIVALFEPARGAAATIVAVAVIFVTASGGVAGLLWGAAASAGMMLAILVLPIAAHFLMGAAPAPSGADLANAALVSLWGDSETGDSRMRFLVAAASGLAVAGLAPFTTAAIVSSGERQALRAGAYGLFFAALIALAVFFDLALRTALMGPLSNGLSASATLLAALILASAGVHSAARAWGLNMAGRLRRYAPLASQRLARSRAAMIAIVGLCAIASVRVPFHPMTALAAAAALSLALGTPLIALALFSRAASPHAIAGVLASSATAVILCLAERRLPDWGGMLVGALASGAAGFVVGWVAGAFSRRASEPLAARHDLFIDAPLDRGR